VDVGSDGECVSRAYRRSIFKPIASRRCNSASALPRASSTGWCVWRVRRSDLKVFDVSLTRPL
jgi:hypothetical protein